MSPIADDLMGDVWPDAKPGPDGASYGTVQFEPSGAFEVRSMNTFTLVFTVGMYGLDDTGAIKIVHRWTTDGGAVQTDAPTDINYVSAKASNGVRLALHVEPYPHQRPWYNGLRIAVEGGYLAPGDTITVIYGDTASGSPGLRLQTFPEQAFEFKVLADVCATGVFLPVDSKAIEIVAGPPDRWVLVSPTLRQPGEVFDLGMRAEDSWGNATGPEPGLYRLRADRPVNGLPAEVTLDGASRGYRVEGLSVDETGTRVFELTDAKGEVLAISNPLVIEGGEYSAYWGDLHGQSGETVGIDPMDAYLRFARDVAFLDVTSHQGNDFQITGAFWKQINDLSRAFDEDGRFTVFPGYEWSGNTPVGGDHNVFFMGEGATIHRSSHALLQDRTDIETDAPTLDALFAALSNEDCVLYAHVGGRPADISYAEDARLRTAVEVHSDWGTFEWMMSDAFHLGYRVGLVCNSDGHKGAPGACYPGASEFGAYSGLTCFLSKELSREAIFASMRARHHYGTTGCRLHLDVSVDLGPDGLIWPVDPRVGESTPVTSARAIMGDIVQTQAPSVALKVGVHAQAPIERIDVLRGDQVVETVRPFAEADLGRRLRIIWEGAAYRGRGRQTNWSGTATLSGARILKFSHFNHWNLERQFAATDEHTISFDLVTTGNFVGCDIWLDEDANAVLSMETLFVSGHVRLADLGMADVVLEAGGLGRQVRVMRLPEQLDTQAMEIEARVSRLSDGDTPIWVRVTTEDGHKAWSSPIYVI